MLSIKIQVIALSLVVYLQIISSTVWLRNPNERGPAAGIANTSFRIRLNKLFFCLL